MQHRENGAGLQVLWAWVKNGVYTYLCSFSFHLNLQWRETESAFQIGKTQGGRVSGGCSHPCGVVAHVSDQTKSMDGPEGGLGASDDQEERQCRTSDSHGTPAALGLFPLNVQQPDIRACRSAHQSLSWHPPQHGRVGAQHGIYISPSSTPYTLHPVNPVGDRPLVFAQVT